MYSEKLAFLFAAIVFGGALLTGFMAAAYFLIKRGILFGLGG